MKIYKIIAVALAAAFIAVSAPAQNKSALIKENTQLKLIIDSLKAEMCKVREELRYTDSLANEILNLYSDSEIKNAIDYISKLPTEFKNRIFMDLLQIKEIRRQLYKNRIYDDWFMRSGRYWEDYGIE